MVLALLGVQAYGRSPARVPSRAPARTDSVRQLRVAIVLLTSSFTKTLTPAEIERVHEEVVEFYAFYQEHGAGKVDFDFSLVQIDRRLARREIAEVSPGRYYLSRDNLQAELTARGFRGRFDEVIALHAWTNANPDRAVQAYGGGAVGPDGQFLGDAGFNSIPVMGRDPNTIGQVLIHEVLHNLDDMFSRSGMADAFLNSDGMSRNMPLLLQERPGAFRPRYTDAEMLAFADRERQGREAYPWALQLVYYGWMLERTPKAAWDRLRYGRMSEPGRRGVRSLYSAIYTSAANDSVYLPVLTPLRGAVDAGRHQLAPRTYTQADFDGSVLFHGSFAAGWVPVGGGRDTLVLTSAGSAGTLVVRQRVASVVVAPELVRYLDAGAGFVVVPRVLQDRCCGDGPPLRADVEVVGGVDPLGLPPGTHDLAFTGRAAGWYVHPARTRLLVRRSWSVRDDGPVIVSLGAPATINAAVRQDRGRDDVEVRATIGGHAVPLSPLGDGRYSVTITDELPFGLHAVELTARAPDGSVVVDTVTVYVRPSGWIRAGDVVFRDENGRAWLDAVVVGRLGEEVRESYLPLVAVVGDRVTPLAWDPAARRYDAQVDAPAGAGRVVVTSLTGDLQRRVLPVLPGRNDVAPRGERRTNLPPYAAAVRLAAAPLVDGDLGDWPVTRAEPARLTAASHLLTDSAVYRGDADLSGAVRFAWDDSTLYVAGEITDDSLTAGESWDTDRVNLVFDMRDDTSPVTYPTANPTLDLWQDDDYWVFWRFGGTAVRRFGKAPADPLPGARLATRRTARGWAFEVALPREALPGYVPFAGQVAGLQVFLTDGDGERTATELMWTARWPYGADGIEWRLAELGRLLFVDAPVP